MSLNRYRYAILLTAALLIIMIMTGGCGGKPVTLEDYAADHPDEVKGIEEKIAMMQTDMMIPSVEYEGNTAVMVLTLTETFEDEDMIEVLAEAFEEGMKEEKVGETMASDTLEISEKLGIDGIKARVELRNGDGSVIWTETYGGEDD